MTEIFVSTDDVKVIGGTANVNVEVDFGPQGDRGNLFLVGKGDPNTVTHSTPLQLLDLYLNIQSTDSDYLMIYQLQNLNGTNQWVETDKIITDKFSVIRTVVFAEGSPIDDITFKLSNIIPLSLVGNPVAENFNIQCTFSDPQNPIAHSIVIKAVTIEQGTGDLILPISINAVKFSGNAWSAISGTYKVHFLITVV